MTNKEIENIVKTAIIQSQDLSEVEKPKIDFKREWYNLKDKKGISSFIKDCTAIVNKFGPDGFIIIGFDEKSKKIHDTYFRDSGLNDTNEIQGIITKRCSDIFEVIILEFKLQGKNVSVIRIPQFYNKPVVVKLHQTFNRDGSIKKEIEQCIWVRKGTTIQHASKSDIDLMYYDRKNIIQEKGLDIQCATIIATQNWNIGFQIQLFNYGTKPLSIIKSSAYIFSEDKYHNIYPNMIYKVSDAEFKPTRANSIIVRPNEIEERIIEFSISIGDEELTLIGMLKNTDFKIYFKCWLSDHTVISQQIFPQNYIDLDGTEIDNFENQWTELPLPIFGGR